MINFKLLTWHCWFRKEQAVAFYLLLFSHCYVWLFATLWTAACQASLSLTISWGLPKVMSIELVVPSNHLILCHHLLLLPSIFPTMRVFSNESSLCIRWPKYWVFSISPFNMCSGWFPVRLTGLISLLSKWLSIVFSITTAQKHQFFCALLFLQFSFTSVHDSWKDHSLDYMDLCQQSDAFAS